MCGIAGIFLSAPALQPRALRDIAGRMGDALIARGPDDGDVWIDADCGLVLAHRRLSIIDLSPEGHQPMVSASGRYVISYNGEIYNYQVLRAQLAYPWRGQSDTEVILAAVEAWGVEKTLAALNGMFAFALWDRQERVLTLARDRMGEKPLYYGWVGDRFVFASEMKAFRALPEWAPPLNRAALQLFMRYSYIPVPHSIYEGIHKLPAAHYVQIKVGQRALEAKPYWSFAAMVAENTASRFSGSMEEVLAALDAQLRVTVAQRMMADVPLGAFLSGGIDSSLIVAMMQAQSPRPVRTFTIGFAEAGFDEAPCAKAVAQHLGTEHTEVYVSPCEAAEVVPLLPTIYDEPFADSSQIPTYLVCKFARQHVTVTLSGDGGDELFGGYNRHVQGPGLWNTLSPFPSGLRGVAAQLALGSYDLMYGLLPENVRRAVRKFAHGVPAISAANREEFYQRICAVHNRPELVVMGDAVPPSPHIDMPQSPFAEWMMLQDALTYFPDDILVKVDRAAMAVSLETRTPFTDPDLMALAWRLPLSMKIQSGKGKLVLRQLLARYVPPQLIERPKAGFAVPIGAWLRGPLKSWAADLLSPSVLQAQGYFYPQAVQHLWEQHQSGRRDVEKQLWNVLMFQAWLASNS